MFVVCFVLLLCLNCWCCLSACLVFMSVYVLFVFCVCFVCVFCVVGLSDLLVLFFVVRFILRFV